MKTFTFHSFYFNMTNDPPFKRGFVILVLFLITSFLTTSSLMAQERTIQGKVTDADDGSPLIGVNVSVKGKSGGTITDTNGQYSITVEGSEAVIRFSFIGFERVEELAGRRSTIDVEMMPSVSELTDVVVTATRQPVSKLETTVAVDVVSSKDINERNYAPTIGDALRFTPGIFVASQRGRIRTNIIMRGFPEILGSEDKYTSMLIDGLPAFAGSGNAYDQFYTPDLTLENIEVVRGAAATLFGRSAAAGVYNVISKTGGEKHSGTVRQTVGNFGLYQTDINLNGPITENFRYNVGGFYLDDEGYREQPANDRGYQFRGNFDWLLPKGSIRVYGSIRNLTMFNNVDVPTDINTAQFMPGFTNRFTLWQDGYNGIDYVRPTGRTAPEIGGDPSNIESGNVGDDIRNRGNYSRGGAIGFKVNAELGNGWSIQNHLRWQQMDLGTGFMAGFNYANPALTSVFTSTGERFLQDVINEAILKKEANIGQSKHLFTIGTYIGGYTQNTRASGFLLSANMADPNDPSQFTNDPSTVGLGPSLAPGILPPGFITGNLLRNSDIDSEVYNTSIFVGDEASLVDDKLKLNLGFRYDHTNIDVLTYLPKSANGAADGPQYPSEFTDSRSVSLGAFSGTLGGNYLLSNKSAVYGNLVRAFRAPDEAIFAPVVRVPPESLTEYRDADTSNPFLANIDQPEIIYNAEFGYRNSFLDGDLRMDLAAYGTIINNRIVSAFREVAPGVTQATAVPEGSISIYGSELSLTYTPNALKGLILRSNFTLQRSFYREFDNFISDPSNPDPEGRVASATGNRVKNIPGFTWNWGVGYEKTIEKVGFGLGVDGNFMADRYGDELNVIKLEDVMLLNGNANLNYTLGNGNRIQLTYRITNLTDVQKVLWVLDLSPIGTLLRTGTEVVPGIPFLPRRQMLSLSYSF